MNPPATIEELFVSERRRQLSRVTVWAMIRQVAAAAGLARAPGVAPAYAAAQLRLRSGQQRGRCTSDPGFSGASVDFLDRKVHQAESLASGTAP